MNLRQSERNRGGPLYPDFRVGERLWPANCARSGDLGRRKKPLSSLEIGVDLFGHLVDRHVANELLAVDKKSWRRIDPKLLRGMVTHRLDAVEQLLSKTMDAVILAPEREVEKWFQWKESALEAKEKLLDSGRILQAGDFLVAPRAGGRTTVS